MIIAAFHGETNGNTLEGKWEIYFLIWFETNGSDLFAVSDLHASRAWRSPLIAGGARCDHRHSGGRAPIHVGRRAWSELDLVDFERVGPEPMPRVMPVMVSRNMLEQVVPESI